MNEIALKQKCVIMRNNVFIWLNDEKSENLKNTLLSISEHKFISIEGRIINTADLTGIYLPEDLNDLYDRKNNRWNGKDEIDVPKYARHKNNETFEIAMTPKDFENRKKSLDKLREELKEKEIIT